MPLVATSLVSPSVNVDQLMPGGGRIMIFRTTIIPSDLIDPTKSIRLSMEIAVDVVLQPDNLATWIPAPYMTWAGHPLATSESPLVGVFGSHLAGKRVRTTITATGLPVDIVGVHEVVSVAVTPP